MFVRDTYLRLKSGCPFVFVLLLLFLSYFATRQIIEPSVVCVFLILHFFTTILKLMIVIVRKNGRSMSAVGFFFGGEFINFAKKIPYFCCEQLEHSPTVVRVNVEQLGLQLHTRLLSSCPSS